MHTRISKPLWQLLIEDHPRSLRILTAKQRMELEKQMIADMKQSKGSIAPGITQGAVRPSQRKPAMNVCVPDAISSFS
ncbi:hypothetical protein JYU08_00605 [bacterium AH-315-B06]|nr:hypothetical protein [bacterium AH-315-B06]